MGFAVVADEVRNLAQRSAQAARDTAALIEESIAQPQRGQPRKVEQVAGVDHGDHRERRPGEGPGEEVSDASRQQAQGIDQVSQAIAQMEKVTQTTAATAEESAAASEELSAQAEGVDEGGARSSKRWSAPAARRRPRRLRRSGEARGAARPRPRREGRGVPMPADAEERLPLDDTGTYGKF